MKNNLFFALALVMAALPNSFRAMEVNQEKTQTTTTYQVPTSQGKIAVWDSQGNGHPVIFIHGNSACGQAFKKQFSCDLLQKYRLIAVDLPGHGESDAAQDTDTYSFIGYAQVIAEVIDKLHLKNSVIVGWSLGGHIALELSKIVSDLRGIVITGTPPIELSPTGLQKGFHPFEGLHLLGHEPQFTLEEAKIFTGLAGFNIEHDECKFLIEAALKTNGAARKWMIDALQNGRGNDETEIVKNISIPLAVIAGENDKGINNEYIDELLAQTNYRNIWGGKVHIIKDAGHAIFWEKADEFNKLLSNFLNK